ncbi:alpha/beta fold hydrolase [Acinetobacter shaoyimingii]|uniref:Alpha/beta fold hydrolase n=1 Tax=Acinetobacter shaoyimingii TaxID=2715164 RepID=A0A6G8RW24_9GAMM|nr:alpha/beta fold hydrolase [Acinetobacter shaoyimingii]QIO05923.1 alpha/beta fold hydrolase [Acinetobacter shaoyimingii]
MILNFQRNESLTINTRPTLVLIHGLFGSLSNLGMLARAFENEYDVIQIDVRNHGLSGQSEHMDYAQLAQDIVDTLDHIGIQNFSVIGHSMGGKIAMKLTEIAPERLQKLVVLDMAPFAYQKNNHDEIFKALFAIEQAQITTRKEATEIMKRYIREDMVIQFLLKSFHKGEWLFNVKALFDEYSKIISWENLLPWEKPTLFIRGEKSPYIGEIQRQAIATQFKNSAVEMVDAGHWLHAEKTNEVVHFIQDFLNHKIK